MDKPTYKSRFKTNKYEQDEIVKIEIDDPRYQDINGKLGVINGIAQDEGDSSIFHYGVMPFFDNLPGDIHILEEKYLNPTGKVFINDESGDVETIKIGVDKRVKVI
jgi:hypothetical protein